MFKIALPVYEGSVDELLFLIKKRRISPLTIEIAKITESYINWLRSLNGAPLITSSNSLVFLSELVLIKSFFILPKPQAIEREETSLVDYIKEYKGYKEMSFWIDERIKEEEKRVLISFKQEEEIKEVDVSVFAIFSSLKELLKKRDKPPVYELVLDKPSLEEKIERIKSHLADIKRIEMGVLLDIKNRRELIITFLAILELMRIRFLKAIQHRPFSTIWIVKR